MKVLKRNGNEENLSLDKIIYRLKKLKNDKSYGALKNVDTDLLALTVTKEIYNLIPTSELDEASARIAIQMSIQHIEYSSLASRIIISNMHKNTNECFSESMELLYKNINEYGLSYPLISDEVINIIRNNKDTINFAIDYSRDYLFDYFGYKTLEKSYLLKIYNEKTKTYKLIERPQHLWMRVALGIHGDDIDSVILSYNLMSQMYFTHASPTLFNAGTPRNQMSSCNLLTIEDSMSGIYDCLKQCAMISKYAAGLGVAISDIRPNGSYIKGTNGTSDGIVKMLKVFNETARFANQGSRRNGSIAIYLEPWHSDIEDFLELKKNSGDDNKRARDLFYALWICDAFMESVESDSDWYLMNPDLCNNLTTTYSTEFTELYYKYVGEGKYTKKIKARDLWYKILTQQIETGMPYMSYKDSVNMKSNQKNIGVIKSSNLCVVGSTMILTNKGYFSIESLVNQRVKIWNGYEFTETTVYQTGIDQEVMTVNFSNGLSLECTPYHKFYVNGSSYPIHCQELKPDMVINKYSLPVIDCVEDRDCKYFQLGSYYTGFSFLKFLRLKNENQNVMQGIDFNDIIIPYENYSIFSKLRWLEGFFDANFYIRNEYDNNVNGFNLLSYNPLSDSIFIDLLYLLNTLGVNASKTNDSLVLTEYNFSCLTSIGFQPRVFKIPYFNKIDFTGYNNISISNIIETKRYADTYCFTESNRNMGVFNGILTGNCNEITLVANKEEVAVCNICTFSLPKFVEETGNKFSFNHEKLYDIVKIATKNMNKIIDRNFYPIPETKNSNMKHRPIAIGIQGFANALFKMKLPFESDEAIKLNVEIMETIQFAGWEASCEIAKELGKTYETYNGSPISKGIFQHDMWGVNPSNRWDWDRLRQSIIKYGVINSMITALPPTASTSQILGNYESFEPVTNNLFMRQVLSGNFPIINKYLVNDLIALKLWTPSMRNKIIKANGSVQNIPKIPENIKKIYKTIWEIPQKHLINLSVARGAFVDHSQSLNIYMDSPTIAKLSSMHMYGWKQGLKTGMYYLRSQAAHKAEQFTIESTDKEEQEESSVLICSIENKGDCQACSG